MPVVLVVDDESANRALVRGALTGSYDVVEAADGPSALALLREQPVDLVLLDVMMPGMDGFEACRAIKAEFSSDTFLPVVLLTALTAQESRVSGLAAGADEFLSKPIDLRELRLRARSLLRIRAQDAQIRAQVEALETQQRFKAELLSLIVHDLRNPLTGILGYLDLLRAKFGTDTTALGYLDNALRNARDLEHLLASVLELRRLEEGALELQRARHDASSLVADAIETLQGAALHRRIELDHAVEPGAWGHFDPGLLKRALENLLANALKISQPDARILLHAEREADCVVFGVADRGPGLSESEKHTFLEPHATSDTQRGFGLGLHLVRRVVEAHAGQLELLDRQGGGLHVRLTLPDVPTLADAE